LPAASAASEDDAADFAAYNARPFRLLLKLLLELLLPLLLGLF
jgi:hypothetical protein